jgi:photosystem II stability/assembly factor-like uncharacterized protein
MEAIRRLQVPVVAILALSALPAAAAVGAWSPLGPEGGPALSLAVDPDDPSIVYAGSEAGILKSTDAGATWDLASRGLLLQAASIGQDTVAMGRLYALTETGIFRSSDDAQSWARIEGSLPEPVHDLAADPHLPNRLWAVTNLSHLYFSSNGGRSWTKRTIAGIAGLNDLVISPAGDWLYANSSPQGLLRSSDLGTSWRPTQGIPKTAYVYDFAFDPGAPSTLYAAATDGLYRSLDKGATWQRIAAAVFSGAVAQVEVQGGRIFAAATQGLFHSSDSGSTWTFGGPPRSQGEVVALAASPDVVFAGAWRPYELGGVFRSLDRGITWEPAQQGFAAVAVNAFAVAPADPDILYAVAGWSDVFQSLDRGATWELLNLGTLPGSYIHLTDILVDSSDATVYLTDLATSRLLRSVDGGVTFSTVQIFAAPEQLALDPRTPGALWGVGFYGVHHSADRGKTWQKVGPKVSRPVRLHEIEVDPRDPKVLWTAGSASLAHGRLQPRIFRSADGGRTWERRDTGVGGKSVFSLALDPAAPNTLYAATDKGLYRSIDAGKTWKLLPGMAAEVTRVVTAPTTPTAVYAFLTGFGVVRSTDRGQTWTPARSGLGALPLLELVVDPGDPRHLYAGTATRGLFEYTQP